MFEVFVNRISVIGVLKSRRCRRLSKPSRQYLPVTISLFIDRRELFLDNINSYQYIRAEMIRPRIK
jgi:hypothetical protein